MSREKDGKRDMHGDRDQLISARYAAKVDAATIIP